MSTEHQQYSTENQAAENSKYAASHDMDIVDTFRDAGRSGLRLDGRKDLQRLLTIVQNGKPTFDAILVYDVSRWGRFQDADESAYYEYLCKRAGLQVIYTAEPFTNDGSSMSSVIKGIKRAMAAEYSRELSKKTFQGQCTVAARGYHQGGKPGYGLRRMLVGTNGQPKGLLPPGQRKAVKDERTILVPGPPEEVDVVRRIYQLCLEGYSTREIAHTLKRDVPENGVKWTPVAVWIILRHEKYTGVNVFNRSSCKLGAPVKRNPPDEWVRCEGAFEPIVTKEHFRSVGEMLARRRPCLMSDEQLLSALRDLLARRGRLSTALIRGAQGMPFPGVFIRRFGSLSQAYKLIGYVSGPVS